MRRFFIAIVQLLFIAFFLFLLREAYHAYQQEKLAIRFAREAAPVRIQVQQVDQKKYSWKDYIGNSKYITFTYRQKPYTFRYIQDSAWVGEGSFVWLWYHPSLDMFRQQELAAHHAPLAKSSRLVNWTVLNSLGYANRWLMACGFLGFVLLVFTTAFLRNIADWQIFKIVEDGLLLLLFLGIALYSTYDTWSNYRYYTQLKSEGQALRLPLLDKDRYAFPENDRQLTAFHVYSAKIYFKEEEREVPVTEADYDQLAKGDIIHLWYNPAMDDIMAADYRFENWKWIFVGICWLLVAGLILMRRKKN